MNPHDAAFWLGVAITVPMGVALVLSWQVFRAMRNQRDDYNPYDPEGRP